MALRPRTETLGLDADWWRFDEHHVESVEAIGLGLLNLALVIAALWGVVRGRVPWVAMAVVYVLLRCALLSTMENSEPRYTLEAMPIVIAGAACALGGAGREGPHLRGLMRLKLGRSAGQRKVARRLSKGALPASLLRGS
jgi:hypothetical protein